MANNISCVLLFLLCFLRYKSKERKLHFIYISTFFCYFGWEIFVFLLFEQNVINDESGIVQKEKSTLYNVYLVSLSHSLSYSQCVMFLLQLVCFICMYVWAFLTKCWAYFIVLYFNSTWVAKILKILVPIVKLSNHRIQKCMKTLRYLCVWKCSYFLWLSSFQFLEFLSLFKLSSCRQCRNTRALFHTYNFYFNGGTFLLHACFLLGMR